LTIPASSPTCRPPNITGRDAVIVAMACAVRSSSSERIFAVATYLSPTPISRIGETSSVLVSFKLPALYPGQYMFDASLSTEEGPFLDQVDEAATFEVLQDGYLGSSHPYFAEMGVVLVPSDWSVNAVAA